MGRWRGRWYVLTTRYLLVLEYSGMYATYGQKRRDSDTDHKDNAVAYLGIGWRWEIYSRFEGSPTY